MSIPQRKSVIALTGIRSEYDLMYPLLRQIHDDGDFALSVVVSGAHNTPLHNYSIEQVRADGFQIAATIENIVFSNSNLAKGKSAAHLFNDLLTVLGGVATDFLLVLGDREEAIVGALVGTYLGIPVIHLAGGDNTCPEGGDIDEQIRHATTKLSHVHLTMHELHAQRIIAMGEEPWRVHVVGSGGIDKLRLEAVGTRELLNSHFGSPVPDDYVVVIHHSLSSDPSAAKGEIRDILEACAELRITAYVGSPNSDPGYEGVLEVIKHYASRGIARPYSNLPRSEFVALLKYARCLIGNSSLAFHEAPYLGLPAINVGRRQAGRLAANNIQFVESNKFGIVDALKRAVHDRAYRAAIVPGNTLYGDGHMAERAVDIIRNLPGKEILLAKKISY